MHFPKSWGTLFFLFFLYFTFVLVTRYTDECKKEKIENFSFFLLVAAVKK